MPTDIVAELRRRAEQARRLSDAIHNLEAQKELRDLADKLDAEASQLELRAPMPRAE